MSSHETSIPGVCPGPEDLAAFVDGRLEGEERRRIVAHLERCAGCYEQVVEISRFLEEEGTGRGARVVGRSAWRRRWMKLGLPLAAMLLLVLSAERWLRLGRADLGVATLAAAVGSPEGDWQRHGWAVVRGGGASAVERDRAFRLGVLAVDLEVALGSAAGEGADRILDAMVALLDAQPGAEAATFLYRQIDDRLSDGVAGEKLRELSARGDGMLAEVLDRTHYELGKWCEAGRLAAGSGGELLGESRYLAAASDFDREELGEGDRRSLDTVVRGLEAGEPASRIGAALEAMIDAH